MNSLEQLSGNDYAVKRDAILVRDGFKDWLLLRRGKWSTLEWSLVARSSSEYKTMVQEVESLQMRVGRLGLGRFAAGSQTRVDRKALARELCLVLETARPALVLELPPRAIHLSPVEFQKIGKLDSAVSEDSWSWPMRTALLIEYLDRNPRALPANVRVWTSDIQNTPVNQVDLVKWGLDMGWDKAAVESVDETAFSESNRMLLECCGAPGSLAGMLAFIPTASLRNVDSVIDVAESICHGEDDHAVLAAMICGLGRVGGGSLAMDYRDRFAGADWLKQFVSRTPAVHRTALEILEEIKAGNVQLESVRGLIDHTSLRVALEGQKEK